jgi:ParB-like chromosome segregation protein Spo0J
MSKKKMVRIPEPAMIALSEINEAPYNPRVMPPEMMAALKGSLRKHGLVLNLVVQRRGMVLVGGHQRLRALREVAREDGVDAPEKVPAVVMDLSDAEAKQLNVSLNNVEGEFDPYKLGELFASIRDDISLEDIAATGFSLAEVEQAIALTLPVEDQITALEGDIGDGVGAFSKTPTLTIDFETTEQRDQAKAVLKELAEKRGTRPGKIVLTALRGFALSKKEKEPPPRKAKKKAA